MKSSTDNKPVAIFDIDGTIFRNSLLIELHWKMVKEGVIPKDSINGLNDKYWNWVRRTGSYDDYLLEVIESFNHFIVGVPTEVIANLARQVVATQSSIVYRFSRDLIEKLRTTHLLVAISGSPEVVVAAFAQAWGFDHYIGTQHRIENGAYAAGPVWVASINKEESLEKLKQQHGFTLGPGSIGVGDTESDAKILALVERPMCINPTRGLYALAEERGWEVIIERKDTILRLIKGVAKMYEGDV
jgi:HAD superfamily phosphoserine phosphatase-like hydrolase